MTGHLCLKWNNHCSAFINSISNIQEKFCDATIVCQGKYFPVHRIILTTCSEYFEEIFDRMECQHPYVVFKDIDAVEMELLLSYMYQGEINVVQEKLPYLIKAAEALKIKGLAVPDDLPLDDDQLERITCSEVEEGSLSRKQFDEKGKKNGSKDTEGYRNVHGENSHGFSISAVVSEGIANKDVTVLKPEPSEIGHYRNLAHVAQASNIHAPMKDDSIHKPEVNITNNDAGCSYINTNMTPGSENVFSAEQSELVYEDSKNASFIDQEEPLDFPNTKEQTKKSKGLYHKCSFCPYKSYNKASVTLHTSVKSVSGRILYRVSVDCINSIQCISQEHLPNYQQRAKFLPPSGNQEKQEPRFDVYGSTSNKLIHHCAYCPYKSYDKSRVTTHTRFKHTRERPFACSYCPKRFVTKLILNRHMQTHTGEKQFQCNQCSFKCIQKVHLQKHMISHTGEKKVYQCEHCSRTFSQLASFKRHQNSDIKCYENAA
ncbi:Sex determination protein fruitless [Armadillidium vulgare]|nr:Sex determination protein fruitless [Armadillidium vulgare]